MGVTVESARVRVPATSANLGPGFDSLGLALDIYDEVEVRTTDGPSRVDIVGEGAGTLATDERHLVVRMLRLGLERAGCPQVGVHMRCHNRIPHSRGMGSSAAAIVAGLGLAAVLSGGALSREDILSLASHEEGHPDNVAPAIYGGLTVSWTDGEDARTLRLDPPEQLRLSVLVPGGELATERARSLLPASVPHADAAFNAARAALLVASLASGGGDLMAATEDRLHQPYRRDIMAESLELMDSLRARRFPAVVSGAGPSVLVFARLDAEARAHVEAADFRLIETTCPASGLEMTTA
ncbi:homoserine kinase [Nanchangia anserum]|uniref:Homoserine kinase n=1 Tax=Nanchangia anserum TaxID=2692125 RepID=A0A8I0KUT2_9ACTO|nr:homoserine kinase [Nanchangia anserum]MBD3690038.1 homoserine kinase [Nanchangia anserum]QOX82166.1 homoserine kinase [Nanchangia anserum]